MSKDNNNFFNELDEHSSVKLKVLKAYIIPWMRKVTLNPYGCHKCLMVDTFAGAGKYKDGEDGSPLILIKEAIEFIKQADSNSMNIEDIFIILIEANKEIFLQLKKNVEKIIGEELIVDVMNSCKSFKKLNIAIINDSHENFIKEFIEDIDQVIPTFIFMDPFGFSLPFDLNKSLLTKYSNIELFINIMYEELGRFIETPKLSKATKILFDEDDLSSIYSEIKGKKSAERRNTISELYKSKLKNVGAEYVLDFDIQKASGHFKMILIHATKNIEGFDLMKDVLNKFSTDNIKDFEYHVNRNQNQLQLFKYPKEEETIKDMADYIYEECQGRVVSSTFIKNLAKKHSYLPAKFQKRALKLLNSKGLIEKTYRRNGVNVKANSFPDDCFIKFK